MPQSLSPTADFALQGAWTPSTDVYTRVDEASRDDSDYASSVYHTSGAYARFDIQAGVDPQASGGHKVYWTAWGAWEFPLGSPTTPEEIVPGPPVYTMVKVYQGAALVSTSPLFGPLGLSPVLYTHTLPAGEADAITDYALLDFQVEFSGGDEGSTHFLGWVQGELPDPPSSSNFDIVQERTLGLRFRGYDKDINGEPVFKLLVKGVHSVRMSDFWAHRPLDAQDAIDSQVCVKTGMRCPASRLVWTEAGPACDDEALEDVYEG